MHQGEIPKWPTGADCKSVVLRLRRFESCSPHPIFTEPSPGPTGPGKQAGVAQLVEHQPSKLRVEGSSLFTRSAFAKLAILKKISQCSSGVEHFHGKEGVGGSIPFIGSKNENVNNYFLITNHKKI